MSFTDIFMTQVLTFQERGSQAEPQEPQAPSRACQRASCGPQGHSLAEPYSQTRPLGPLSAAYLPWGGLALPAFLAKPACRRALCLRARGGSADRSRGGAAGRAPGLSAGRCALLQTLPISRVLIKSSAVESDRRNAVREWAPLDLDCTQVGQLVSTEKLKTQFSKPFPSPPNEKSRDW